MSTRPRALALWNAAVPAAGPPALLAGEFTMNQAGETPALLEP